MGARAAACADLFVAVVRDTLRHAHTRYVCTYGARVGCGGLHGRFLEFRPVFLARLDALCACFRNGCWTTIRGLFSVFVRCVDVYMACCSSWSRVLLGSAPKSSSEKKSSSSAMMPPAASLHVLPAQDRRIRLQSKAVQMLLK